MGDEGESLSRFNTFWIDLDINLILGSLILILWQTILYMYIYIHTRQKSFRLKS